MKILVEVIFWSLAATLINNVSIPTAVLGDSRGLNGSTIFGKGRMEEYSGSDEEYGDYNNWYGDHFNYPDDGDYADGDVGSDGDGRGRRGSLGASSQFWGNFLNVHEHHHKVVGVNWDADEDTKCLKLGTKCDDDHENCCDSSGRENSRLCDKNLLKCVKCKPNEGDPCLKVPSRCCDENDDVYCLPKPGEEGKDRWESGICKRVHCITRDGAKCGGKKKCCPGFECRSGKCWSCQLRGCDSKGVGCCKGYWCSTKGNCFCEKLNKHCSKSYACCPPYVCSSDPGIAVHNPGSAFDPICRWGSNCADGTNKCKRGQVCINDVCVAPTIKRGYSCGGEGDNRKCTNPGDVCQNTCEDYCSGHLLTYCSDSKKKTRNCKCGTGSSCKTNLKCDGGNCCYYRADISGGSDCRGTGQCQRVGYAHIFGCWGGKNGATTSGRVEGHDGISKGGIGYKACPANRELTESVTG